MYRPNHLPLATAALAAAGLHFTLSGVAWSVVLTGTAIGASLSLVRIGVDLGAPHPVKLFHTLQHRHALARGSVCVHCHTAHGPPVTT